MPSWGHCGMALTSPANLQSVSLSKTSWGYSELPHLPHPGPLLLFYHAQGETRSSLGVALCAPDPQPLPPHLLSLLLPQSPPATKLIPTSGPVQLLFLLPAPPLLRSSPQPAPPVIQGSAAMTSPFQTNPPNGPCTPGSHLFVFTALLTLGSCHSDTILSMCPCSLPVSLDRNAGIGRVLEQETACPCKEDSSLLAPLQAAWPWGGFLTSLSLSFVVYKMV